MQFGPTKAAKQFVSTFKEWHYFIGGFALGMVVATPVGLALALAAVYLAIRAVETADS